MTKKPMFSFNDTTSTGLDLVPLNSQILIESSTSGNPQIIVLTDSTNITNATTIDWLLTNMKSQWNEVGGVVSDTTVDTGTDKITNLVSCTQAEYDASSKEATTLYIIIG